MYRRQHYLPVYAIYCYGIDGRILLACTLGFYAYGLTCVDPCGYLLSSSIWFYLVLLRTLVLTVLYWCTVVNLLLDTRNVLVYIHRVKLRIMTFTMNSVSTPYRSIRLQNIPLLKYPTSGAILQLVQFGSLMGTVLCVLHPQ